jgi:thiamine-monophosphate kinase
MPRARPTFSERGFHAWLARTLGPTPLNVLPMGDDTSATPIGGGRVALLTTDALSEGTHFLSASPPRAIGRAAAGASLSDIAAKGGRPVALLLDLLLPPAAPERWAR